MSDETTETTTHPEGQGLRPAFNANWHLAALGVGDDDPVRAEGAEEPVIVVMDTPMAHDHPNLKGVIDTERARDFSVLDTGVASFPTATESYPHLAPNIPGAHGTAVAGLIGARPATVSFMKAAYLDDGPTPAGPVLGQQSNNFPLPYQGIDPTCTIIPVSLTAAPFPEMVQGALDYIKTLEPDIVVIAAAWAEDADLEAEAKKEELESEAEKADAKADAEIADAGAAAENAETGAKDGTWEKVSETLVEIGKTSIVLCAAGNERLEKLAYPARLCTVPDTNIWAVAACREDGTETTYSPLVKAGARMLKTLSTEHPIQNRETVLNDKWDRDDDQLKKFRKAGSDDFPPRDIISLDPPGVDGYNPSPYHQSLKRPFEEPNPYLEIGSLYTRFSGTSAAVAIAAGLISRVIAKGNQKSPAGPIEGLFNLDAATKKFGTLPAAQE